MGADMLVEFVRAPSVTHDVALERVPLFIGAATPLDLVASAEYLSYLTAGEEPDLSLEGAAGLVAGLLVLALTVLYEERRRDVIRFTDSAGAEWLVTGGMSWGDDPTDAFNPFHVLAFTGFDVVLADPAWTPSKRSN